MKKFLDELLEWIRPALKACILALVISTFVIKLAVVSGSSMYPTLVDRDFLILWSLGYKPAQGDIVACNCEGLNEVIVKRIVASEGQEVDIDFIAGNVYVDGELFEVNGIDNITLLAESNYDYPITVPAGEYFVMGDNRQHSTDSRDARVGFVSREDILGKAVLRLLPINKFGGLYR